MAFAIYQKVTSARASIFPHKHVPIEVIVGDLACFTQLAINWRLFKL